MYNATFKQTKYALSLGVITIFGDVNQRVIVLFLGV